MTQGRKSNSDDNMLAAEKAADLSLQNIAKTGECFSWALWIERAIEIVSNSSASFEDKNKQIAHLQKKEGAIEKKFMKSHAPKQPEYKSWKGK